MKLLIGLAVALVLLMVAAVLVYRHLAGNIRSDPAFDRIIGQRPAAPSSLSDGDSEPLNILVIGDDTRIGHPEITPGLSDTNILLHLSADRSRAYAVSIPRDLMVQRPACRSKSDPSTVLPAAGPVMWNAAYGVGGVACTIAQFEHMTNIRIDHFVVVRFSSFNDMVDALGGVPVCVPKSVQEGSVRLPAGTYEVSGDRALVYVQQREGVGDGSDIGRMLRQQRFLAAMVKKGVSAGTLVNPIKLYSFLDAATSSLITDPAMADIPALVGLAHELKGIGLDQVEFLTMPFDSYAPDPNRLAVGRGADRLWTDLRQDKPIDRRFSGDSTTAAGGVPGRPGTGLPLIRDDADRYGLCNAP
jgi:LCP family protein required for cell wall assembly